MNYEIKREPVQSYSLVKLTGQKTLDTPENSIRLSNYIHGPIKKIRLVNLPTNKEYHLTGHVNVKSKLNVESKCQEFNFTSNINEDLKTMKEVAVNNINEKMTKEQTQSSLNFDRVSEIYLDCQKNVDKIVLEFDGYEENVEEKIVEYTRTVEINCRNLYNLNFIDFPVEKLKVINFPPEFIDNNSVTFFTDKLRMESYTGLFRFETKDESSLTLQNEVEKSYQSKMQQRIDTLFNQATPIHTHTLDFSRLNYKYIQFNKPLNGFKPILEWTCYNVEMFANGTRCDMYQT